MAALGNKPNNFSWKTKDIEVKAGDLNTSEGLHKHIKDIQEVGNAKKEISTERGETKIEHWINEPVTVIVLENGVKVNILSQKVEGSYKDINGKILDAKSLAEFRAIKESPAGQRVLMGHAMCTIEEMFHIQQFADSQAVISKTYADFLSKNAKISRADDYFNAVNGLPHSGEGKLVHNRSMRTMEQEVVAALYDAKMPVEILRLYYECNYPVERRPIMDYLRHREQSGK